jgi:hypothetical protein
MKSIDQGMVSILLSEGIVLFDAVFQYFKDIGNKNFKFF